MTYRRLLEDGASRLLQEDGASFQLAEQDGVPAALQGASVGAGTSAGALTTAGRLPYAAMPQFSGADQGAYWLRPGSTAIRDNGGAHDLVLLGHTYAGGSNALHLASSQDGGGTWAWQATSTDLGLGTISGSSGLEHAVQDSAGTVHFTFKWSSGSVYYSRLTLTRDGDGHVTGFSGLATALDVSALTGPNGGDYRAVPHIFIDGTAAERLAVSVACDGANSGQYVYLALATSLAPTALSNFVDLSGTTSTASLALNQTAPGGGSYDHAHGIAQDGATGDLYVSCGNVIAEAAPTVATDLVWVRLTVSGSTWTVGSTTTHAVSGGCWYGGTVGTAAGVLVGYFPATTTGAPTFRLLSGGSVSDPGIGSPSLSAFSSAATAAMTFNRAADGRLWVVYSRDSTADTGGWGTCHYSGAFWNGSAWTVYAADAGTARGIQANAQSFAYGLGGLVDAAFEGLVAVQSNCQGANFSGTLAIMGVVGGTLAAGAELAGASVGTGTSTGTLTTSGAAALQGASVGAGTSAGALTTAILLAGASTGAESGTGALTTAVRLAGASVGAATTAAALTTAVQLAGASAGASTTAAALTTAILLGGASTGAASSTGTLTGAAAALAGASVGGEAGAGALTTAILLAGASQGNASSSGTLTGTATLLAGASVGAATSTASLTTAILLGGASVGAESGTASLGGAAALQGASVGAASSSASLTTGIALAGASVAGEAGAGALTTGILLAGASVGAGTSTGSLDAGGRPAGRGLGGGRELQRHPHHGGAAGRGQRGAEVGSWALLWGNAATLTPWAWWPFEADTSTQVFDSTGRVAPLTVRSSGGYPARVLRGSSWGWQFSRVGATPPGSTAVSGIYGEVADPLDFAALISGEWTWAFWYRPETPVAGLQTTVTLFGLRSGAPAAAGSNSTQGYQLNAGTVSGTLQISQVRLTSQTSGLSSTCTWVGLLASSLNQWRHIIIRRTLPSGPNGLASWGLWLDGVQVAPSTTASQPGPAPAVWWPGEPGRVGLGEAYLHLSNINPDAHLNGLDGSLDNLTLYNQACTDAEALALYQAALVTGPWAYPGTVRQASPLALGATASLVSLPASASPTTQGATATPGTGPVTVEVYPA